MDKKISELDQALLLNNDADFPLSQDNAGEPTTFRAKLTQLATKIAEDMTFSNLQTTSKKLVGAINELLSLGSPIIIGTTAPTSSQGADGNIYVQYTAGTGGADDEVDGIYVKINGAWCEISTGGGSGTTDYEDLSNKPQVNSVELVGNKSLDDLGIMPASLSKTASGSLVHITDGADNIPVKSLVSQIVAVESGSGEKSPTNPYTISGFANGVITRCGKNLFNFSPTTVTSSRTIASNIFLKAGDYVCSFLVNNTTAISGYFQVRIGTTSIGGVNFAANYQGIVSKAFTLSEDSTVNIFVGGASAGYNFEFSNGQIELGNSSPTTYEAYSENDYTFTFGQTVYGGHFDNKGNLVVTHELLTLDGTESFLLIGSGTIRRFRSDTQYNQYSNIHISSHFVETSSNSQPWGNFRYSTGYLQLCDNNEQMADVTALQTWIANQYSGGTPVRFLCELANPITLAITSQDIPTLLGENNIFSNCDDVEVDYYTDNADEIVEVAKATASTSLHNYSTDEQIVGTWIDGSTLYEKTQYGGVSIIEADTWYDTSITGIDKTVMVSGTLLRSGEEVGLGTFNSRWIVRNNTVKISLSDLSGDTWSLMSITVRYTKSST